MKTKNITIRIDEKTLEKLRAVAKYEMRSLNSQINIIIMQSIREFEDKYGIINNPPES
ncbi:MAG: Arc family DNA-binding protein [Oscillospiraceae bacterium]|nr:Arc family DNA-binding protein [Oscillospiraceae bacterium]